MDIVWCRWEAWGPLQTESWPYYEDVPFWKSLCRYEVMCMYYFLDLIISNHANLLFSFKMNQKLLIISCFNFAIYRWFKMVPPNVWMQPLETTPISLGNFHSPCINTIHTTFIEVGPQCNQIVTYPCHYTRARNVSFLDLVYEDAEKLISCKAYFCLIICW